jgi:hypothetical protein
MFKVGDPPGDVCYTYGYYFGLIQVDPSDAQRVYIGGVPLWTSGDGGAITYHIHWRRWEDRWGDTAAAHSAGAKLPGAVATVPPTSGPMI